MGLDEVFGRLLLLSAWWLHWGLGLGDRLPCDGDDTGCSVR